MNLKKGLYKILYDEKEIDLSDGEELQTEQLLNQYCQGTLDELNTEKINQIIGEDEKLAQKIADYKAILGGVETFFMQKSVANAAQNYFQSEKHKSPLHIVANNKNRQNRRLWLSYSAAAVALILIGFFAFPIAESEPLAAKDLYEKYSTEKPSSTTLGAENEAIRLANQAYRMNNYSEAVTHFEAHFKNKSQEPIEAFLYYGISLYRQSSPEYDKAIEVFKQIINANNYYSNLARWHLALQYLKKDNTTKAQQVLEELLPLTEAGSSRRGDVENILNSLKK